MRVQTLPNTVVGILSVWDDGGQTTKHSEWMKATHMSERYSMCDRCTVCMCKYTMITMAICLQACLRSCPLWFFCVLHLEPFYISSLNITNLTCIPESNRPRHRVIAVDHREDPFDKLIHVEDLLQVLLALLGYLQHAEPQEVIPEEKQPWRLAYLRRKLYQQRTWSHKCTYPSRNMSASFRNAELMRIGKGYFWKSLGNSTTASHCSPSLPDLNPGIRIRISFITSYCKSTQKSHIAATAITVIVRLIVICYRDIYICIITQ